MTRPTCHYKHKSFRVAVLSALAPKAIYLFALAVARRHRNTHTKSVMSYPASIKVLHCKPQCTGSPGKPLSDPCPINIICSQRYRSLSLSSPPSSVITALRQQSILFKTPTSFMLYYSQSCSQPFWPLSDSPFGHEELPYTTDNGGGQRWNCGICVPNV